MRALPTRVFVVAALVVTLALAGGVSYYASSSPDGLSKVAADKGFDAQQRDSVVTDSPMAGYATKGVDNERLSGGLAGAVGVGVVLVLAGGLAYAVRRRGASTEG